MPRRSGLDNSIQFSKDSAEVIDSSKLVSSDASGVWSHLPEEYSPTVVKLTLYCLFFVNLFMNVDMGILAAGTQSIKKELGYENTEYGTLGSVVYFGQMLGCIFSAFVLAKANAKLILIVCLLLNVLALLTFTQFNIFGVLIASRTLTGLF